MRISILKALTIGERYTPIQPFDLRKKVLTAKAPRIIPAPITLNCFNKWQDANLRRQSLTNWIYRGVSLRRTAQAARAPTFEKVGQNDRLGWMKVCVNFRQFTSELSVLKAR